MSWNQCLRPIGLLNITLGPRYGPAESAARIAADYITGIEELTRTRRLEKTSVFVKEVTKALEAIAARDSPTRLVLTTKPQTAVEAEILNGFRLSLDVGN